MKIARIVVPALLALAVACGASENNNTNPDGGAGGGGDGGGGGGGGGGDGLTLNASLGIYETNLPAKGEESGLAGTILIKEGDEDVKDAVVKVNGVEIPVDSVYGWHDTGLATSKADVGPGKTVTITATRGTKSASISFTCPSEVTLNAPTAAVAQGETINVSATGKLNYDNIVANSHVQVRGWTKADKLLGLPQNPQGPSNKKLDATTTSATLEIPELRGTEDAWVVELAVPGDYKYTDNTSGYCGLYRRALLEKK
ncbi:MAG: hypothetical protein ACK4N5_03135 [Myxococcales bacterium]